MIRRKRILKSGPLSRRHHANCKNRSRASCTVHVREAAKRCKKHRNAASRQCLWFQRGSGISVAIGESIPGTRAKNGAEYGSCCLDSGHDHPGSGDHGTDVRLRHWLRQSLKGATMLLLTAIVTLLLFIYLLAALLRPEWF